MVSEDVPNFISYHFWYHETNWHVCHWLFSASQSAFP